MALAEAIVRRRAWLAAGWLGAAALLLPSATRVAQLLDVGATVDGSESAAVERLLRGPLASAYARYAVLVIDGGPSPASAAGDSVLGRILTILAPAPEVSGTFSFRDGGDSLFLAPRGTFVVVGLATTPTRASADEVMPRLRGRTEPLERQLRAEHPEVTLRWTGESALNHDLRASSNADVGRAERRALPLIVLFLVLAFGALAAALVPVLCGALAIAISLGLAAIVARIWPLSILLQSVVTMLGLGLGIDYALLTITRFREGLAAGQDGTTAAVQAARHAGHTILVAAATVAIGFVALLFVPLNEMRAIAGGGLMVVLTSALLATTLLLVSTRRPEAASREAQGQDEDVPHLPARAEGHAPSSPPPAPADAETPHAPRAACPPAASAGTASTRTRSGTAALSSRPLPAPARSSTSTTARPRTAAGSPPTPPIPPSAPP